MRTRARVYHEPRLTEAERPLVQTCPRDCGGLLSEEAQPGANNAPASVLFCVNEHCGWREWTVSDVCGDVERLARQGHHPLEIAARLGMSERTVFRRLAEGRRAGTIQSRPRQHVA